LLDPHIGTAASRDIDDRAGTLCQNRTNLPEVCRITRGTAIFAVSGVEMENRGPGLGSLNSDMVGVWTEPVIAQEMMILRLFFAISVSIGLITGR
jgi:hypothetical protein